MSRRNGWIGNNATPYGKIERKEEYSLGDLINITNNTSYLNTLLLHMERFKTAIQEKLQIRCRDYIIPYPKTKTLVAHIQRKRME